MSHANDEVQAETAAWGGYSSQLQWVREVLNIDIPDVPPPDAATVAGWQQEAHAQAEYLGEVNACAAELGNPPGCLLDEAGALEDARNSLDDAIRALRLRFGVPAPQRKAVDGALDALQKTVKDVRAAVEARAREQAAFLKRVNARVSELGDPPGGLPGELRALEDARGVLDGAIAALRAESGLPDPQTTAVMNALKSLQDAATNIRADASNRLKDYMAEIDAAIKTLGKAYAPAESAMSDAIKAWEKAHVPVAEPVDGEVKEECAGVLAASKDRLDQAVSALEADKRTYGNGFTPLEKADIEAVQSDAKAEEQAALVPVAAQIEHLGKETAAFNAQPTEGNSIQLTNSLKRDTRALGRIKDLAGAKRWLGNSGLTVDEGRKEGAAAMVLAFAQNQEEKPEIVRMKVSANPVQRIGPQLDTTPAADAWTDFVKPKVRRLADMLSDDKIVALARTIHGIGDPSADVNVWLVDLVLNGVPINKLAEFHANLAALRGLALSNNCLTTLSANMGDLALVTDVSTLSGGGQLAHLKQAAICVRVLKGSMTAAQAVLADQCSLFVATKPDNAAEGQIGAAIGAGYVIAKQERTIKTKGIGNGHAYKFHYFGGQSCPWELHVHKNTHPDTWYPEWKPTSNPYANSSPGRATYRMHQGLKSAL